ncbi:MAG: hypothetical protein AB7S39_06980 [Gemmatimonadales bacterium]
MSRGWLLVAIVAAGWNEGAAQEAGAGQSGRRPLLPRGREIALARSAAPASVSGRARVLVLTDSGFVEAAAGTNGVTCLVGRSWVASLEPACFDPEAGATVMAAEIFRTEAYHRGRPKDEVDRDVAARLADGRIRLPTRPALVYMMSSGQQLISDDGRPAGNWQPHLMLYVPYLTNPELGLPEPPDFRSFMVNVSDAGKPWATLIVPLATFIDP